MGGEGNGWNTGVCDTNVGETVDAEVGIHHAALFAGQHGAGGGGVEFRSGNLAQPFEPLLVGLDAQAGGGFAAETVGEGAGLAKSAGELHAGDEGFGILMWLA